MYWNVLELWKCTDISSDNSASKAELSLLDFVGHYDRRHWGLLSLYILWVGDFNKRVNSNESSQTVQMFNFVLEFHTYETVGTLLVSIHTNVPTLEVIHIA